MGEEVKYFYSGDLLVGELPIFFSGIIAADANKPVQEVINHINYTHLIDGDRILIKAMTLISVELL